MNPSQYVVIELEVVFLLEAMMGAIDFEGL